MDENKTPFENEETKEEIKVVTIQTDATIEEKKKKSGKSGRAIFVIILVVILLVAGISAIAIVLGGKTTTNKGESKKETDKVDTEASIEVGEAKEYSVKSSDDTLTAVEVAEKTKPYVMAVITYKNNTVYGEGSGIFMSEDKDGKYTYILTCAHIIDTKGVDIKIEMEDGKTYDAEIVGYDSRTDVGVLRVKATGFTIAEFGDSSVLKVGEPVYAIGNPGGTAFFGSFTGGLVSAIDRPTATSSSAYTMECIQHDAAINPGNSGGALVNSYGQVVGMNSSKIADEEYEGMGFAIPINVAKEVVDDILESGYVQNRAKLGISYVEASQNQTYSMIVKMNDLPSGSLIIAEIDKDSGLYDTDVEAGDIIIAVNGKDIESKDTLLSVIEKSEPGDKIELTIAHVNRDYKVDTFDVTVELAEDTGSSETVTEDSSEGDFTNPFAE